MAITTIDNDTRFWLVGEALPRVTTIAIQNGIRGGTFDVFESSPSTNSRVDYLFCFSESIGQKFKTHGNFTHVMSHGSLKSNHIPIVRSPKKGVAWISQFSPGWRSDIASSESFYAAEKKAFRFFADWALRAEQSLSVFLRSQGDSAAEEELWFRTASPNTEIKFLRREHLTDNYVRSDSMELVATCDSTLGYEALSRGTKVVFLGWRPHNQGALPFGWPSSLEEDGPFWNSSMNSENAAKVLSDCLNVSSTEFHKEHSGLIRSVMERDPGNQKLFQTVSEVLRGVSR